jgi:hypothetical protein
MKSAATLLLLVFYTFISAQSANSNNCIARWKKGDEQVILIKHRIEKSWAGKPEPLFEFSYEALIQVLDSAEEIGNKVSFLLSEKSSPATGQLI